MADCQGTGPVLALACHLHSVRSGPSQQESGGPLQLLLVACLGVVLNTVEEASPLLKHQLALAPTPLGTCLQWLCTCAVRHCLREDACWPHDSTQLAYCSTLQLLRLGCRTPGLLRSTALTAGLTAPAVQHLPVWLGLSLRLKGACADNSSCAGSARARSHGHER